ncbi:MAG: hypothetical protein K5751_10195 [Treponemataceae bacterium]|nr:hypothetical protein [Treponemataceae bacterium]
MRKDLGDFLYRKFWNIAFFFAFLVFSGLTADVLFAQSAADRGFADERFRRGVQAYYRGAFNDAVLQFEDALTYTPEDNRILEWLGKAYYRAGMEDAALQEWNYAAQNGYGGQLLQNTIEIVSVRRIFTGDYGNDGRFIESGSFPAIEENVLHYSQPVSILPNKDGSFWVSAYGSNEIIRVNVNGVVVQRSDGPLNGFDRPFDMIRMKGGTIVVSEFAGDRITFVNENGRFIKSFGSKGRGDGELLGPQFMAQDSNGNIFVTDYGNKRVAVFNEEGEFLFNFGKFKSPTGIAVYGDNVYIADNYTGSVYCYDLSGNYEGIFVPEDTFDNPEAMRLYKDGLLICDGEKLYSVSIETGAPVLIANTGNGPSHITCAEEDANGNIIAADFKANELYVLARMPELIGGLYVEISRVNADKFPNIDLEVRVENRRRQPVVGLTDINFFITEGKYAVTGQTLTGCADLNDNCDITVIIDRSLRMKAYETDVQYAIREIAASMKGKGTMRIVSSGYIPTSEITGTPSEMLNFSMKQIKTEYSDVCSTDLAIRLAANDLVNGEHKRAVVFITDGRITNSAFANYTLTDLSSYLNNNGISFALVSTVQQAAAEELSFIMENTSGDNYYLYRSEGISSIVSDLVSVPSGIYTLSYTSGMATDFGRSYLPVELEVYLLNRSGRAETGYFAPLE